MVHCRDRSLRLPVTQTSLTGPRLPARRLGNDEPAGSASPGPRIRCSEPEAHSSSLPELGLVLRPDLAVPGRLPESEGRAAAGGRNFVARSRPRVRLSLRPVLR